MTLPKKIRRFLQEHKDYEAAFAPDADLMLQVRTGRVHPYIVHHCAHATRRSPWLRAALSPHD